MPHHTDDPAAALAAQLEAERLRPTPPPPADYPDGPTRQLMNHNT